jgi:acyl-coenzyme A thioesterase PaaI-like protein
MVMYGEDDRVWGELEIDERHQGAPGFAHGGAIATALDDAFGALLRLIEKPAVTVHIEVDYRRPWLLGVPHRIEAELDRIEGRKLFMRGQALDGEGQRVAEATTMYLIVGVEHFMEGMQHAREQPGQAELPW